MKSRVDYDAIASLYDSSPYRERPVDPELLAFMAQRASGDTPSILDVGCGTGNQLVADRAALSSALLVGVDKSLGMLRQASPKAPGIAWVKADGSALPFEVDSFDFVTCQFAFHHLRDKAGMLREAFRVLRPEGRLVLRNMCPQECADWLYYKYFPEARALDLEDFWPLETISAVMEASGFVAVSVEREHLHFAQDLRVWFDTVRRRDTCSQLLAIGDDAYEAGLRRLAEELAEQRGPLLRDDHLCLVTIRGEAPGKSWQKLRMRKQDEPRGA
jgi:ubiquinone/menaquinone biosynthesis C-methylase UbiE